MRPIPNSWKLVLVALLILAGTVVDGLTAQGQPIWAYCSGYGYDSSDSDLEDCVDLFGWEGLENHHSPPVSGPLLEDQEGWDCSTMGNLICGPEIEEQDLHSHPEDLHSHPDPPALTLSALQIEALWSRVPSPE